MNPADKKHILIVEDEMEMRFYLMTLVRSLGYEPVMTRNGIQGLEALGEAVPALIILDIMMPEKGGALVYQEIKADDRFRAVPLLIFSGVEPNAFAHYIRMLNAASGHETPLPKYYVEKSADPDYLKEMIRKCIREPD